MTSLPLFLQKLLLPEQLHDYQKRAVEFQCSRNCSALWLDLGLGKTAVTLTSISSLIKNNHLKAVLVVAPLRVCRLVWRQEALKWTHTSHLKFATVIGTPDQRVRQLMQKNTHVFLINYENLEWLAGVLHTYFISKGVPLPFDGIVFDEITNCKNSSTNRVKALRKIMHCFKWRTGLTATPASNGFKDLHGQYLVLDDGERLGKTKSHFMSQWYKPKQGFKEIPYADSGEKVKELIGDMTLEMSADDYLKMPDMIINNINIELPDNLRDVYETMEKNMFLELDSGDSIEIFNKGALMNKCLQYSNGAVYKVAGQPEWERIHDLKLDALEEILEGSPEQPILCSYAYRSDAERIMNRFAHLDPINLTECKSEKSLKDAMHRWKTGNCRLMIGHPASMGHGIDGLQERGHILVWYGLTWSLDRYNQFNGRIRRQGQGVPVICHRILTVETVDEIQMEALESKSTTEAELRRAVRNYRHKYNK